MTGIPFHRSKSTEMDQATIARLVRAYQSDDSPTTAALAKRFGRGAPAIREILRAAGVLRETAAAREPAEPAR